MPKISELPALDATNLDGNETLLAEKDGVLYRANASELANSRHPQVIGQQGVLPNGTANLSTGNWVLRDDPILGRGTLKGVRVYAANTGTCRLQVVRIVGGIITHVGAEFQFAAAAAGFEEFACDIDVEAGDLVAIKGGNGTLRYLPGAYNQLKGSGSGLWFIGDLSGEFSPPAKQFHTVMVGFDLEVGIPETHQVTVSNSSKIAVSGDSYSADPYTLPGKSWLQKVSDFSDWRLENAAVSGRNAKNNLLFEIRGWSQKYGDFGIKDINTPYILIRDGANTDSNFNFADGFRWMSKLGEGARALGANIIWGEPHVPVFEATQMLYSALAQKIGGDYFPNLAYAQRVQPAQAVRNPGFWSSQHYNVRLNDIAAAAVAANIAETLERPAQSIRFFRKRPDVAVAAIDDLEFDDVFDRARLFQEIKSGQMALKPANIPFLDSVNGFAASDTEPVVSEYFDLQAGKAVTFADYALCEVILGTNQPDAVRLFVSDLNVTVYVRDDSYMGAAYGEVNDAAANWRELPVIDGYASFYGKNSDGKIDFDKVAFILYKAGGFTITQPHAIWYGKRDKLNSRPARLQPASGAELFAGTEIAPAGVLAAGWAENGAPTFGTGGIGGDYPAGFSGHVTVDAASTISQDVVISASIYDREIEVTVTGAIIRALVDSGTYPAGASITEDSFDWELLTVKASVGGGNAVPFSKELGVWFREARFRIPYPAGATSVAIELSSQTGQVSLTHASARLVCPYG